MLDVSNNMREVVGFRDARKAKHLITFKSFRGQPIEDTNIRNEATGRIALNIMNILE